MIFNMTGSGEAPLNFKVVPNPQPDTANENTIWVDTDRINNYYFSATQPEGMVDYDVWFPVGTSSAVEFNALKKGGIQVYPLSAKQMVSGALVDKTVKIYQNGAWVDWWKGELYTPGNEWVNVTGGWKARGIKPGNDSSYYVAAAPTLTMTGEYMQISPASAQYGGGVVEVANDIDLTNISTISIEFEGTVSNNIVTFRTFNRNSAHLGEYVAYVELLNKSTTAKKVVTLNVSSLTGKYDVSFAFANFWNNVASGTIKVYSVTME